MLVTCGPLRVNHTRLVLSGRRRLLVVYRTRTTAGTRPVLDRQPFDAGEFGGIVGDEPEPKTAGVSGNEEIVGADHLPPFPQVGTYLSIVGRGVVGKPKTLHVGKERLERRVILRSTRRHFNAVEQLRLRDDRDADVRHGNRL